MHSAARMSMRLSALTAALAIVLSACSDGTIPTAPTGTAAARSRTVGPESAPAHSPAQARYEIEFMTGMIDHHHMASMMSMMCLDKAIHERLIAQCEQIIAAQSAEIEQMQGWLREWYRVSYEPRMMPSDMKMMERMAAMSPREFEIAFMKMMVEHHTEAVKEGRRCLEHAYHEGLRDLCADIVETQTQEIALLKYWLCAWYGICRWPLGGHAS